jgi:hypothetical protein
MSQVLKSYYYFLLLNFNAFALIRVDINFTQKNFIDSELLLKSEFHESLLLGEGEDVQVNLKNGYTLLLNGKRHANQKGLPTLEMKTVVLKSKDINGRQIYELVKNHNILGVPGDSLQLQLPSLNRQKLSLKIALNERK